MLLYVAGDVERHPGPEHTKRVLATLNVAGKLQLRGKGSDTSDWGSGVDMGAETTQAWNEI